MRVSSRSSAGESAILASPASLRSCAIASSGLPAMARKFSIKRARRFRQGGRRAERGLLQEAVGDFADRAAADGGDAGDRQQVGDQRVRGLRIGARERREHALIIGAAVGRAEREPVEILREVALAIEIFLQPPLPGRREIERVHERREQSDIADADVRRAAIRNARSLPDRAKAFRRPPPRYRCARTTRCRPAGFRPGRRRGRGTPGRDKRSLARCRTCGEAR